MSLYNMYYPCSCGTRKIITVDGNTAVTADTWAQECPNCGKTVKLDTVSSAIKTV